MTSTEFPLHRVIGERPAAIPADATVFNAPRPLYGTEVDSGLMGFTVHLAPDAYRRADFVGLNRGLDARVVEWLTQDQALAEARAYVTAEYGADVADGADEATLLDSWAHRFRLTTTNVEADVEVAP